MKRAFLLLALAAASGCGGPSGPGGDGGDTADPAEVRIPAIQGKGHMSPLLGETVTTTGLVTGLTERGLFLQDLGGDGDIGTSDALFVVAGDPEVRVGDELRVTGRVAEHVPDGRESANLPVTRLESASVEVLSSGNPLPDPVVLGSGGRVPPRVEVIGPEELPVDLRDPDEAVENEFDPETEGIDFYESLEWMRVRVVDPVAVSPTASFDGGAAEVFTLVEEGAHVAPDDARTARGGILLQPHPDNRGDHNPERVQIHFDPALYPADPPLLTAGDELSDVVGLMGYGSGNFEVLATRAVRVAPGGLERETTELTGTAERVTVATYNVLNLNPLPETAERMARLGRHIATRLGAPDVVALQEIQDENGTRGGPDDFETDATATLRALADAVAAAGGPRYEFFDVAPAPNSSGGVPGGNIRNAFLYDPSRVELVDFVSLRPSELERVGAPDPDAFEGSRDPLAATFEFRGRSFTVVNNHFTSRFGSTPVFGAVQPFVQAGEEAREAQARAVHAWVTDRLEGSGDVGVAVVGDLNTFEFTDDLTELLPAGGGGERILESLMLELPPGDRHTYVFEGNSQTLDHVFVTGGLRNGAEADVVHVNAEYPAAAGRGSDHEPVVARLPVGG